MQGETMEYTVPNEATIQNWLEESFIVDAETPSSNDLVASFKPPPVATLYYLPRTSEVAVHSSHWRIDGIGILQLLDRFFSLVVEGHDVKFGDEGKNLSPSLEEVAGCPSQPTSEIEGFVSKLVSETWAHMPSVGLPFKGDVSTLPEGTRHQSITFSESASHAIVTGCKAKGVSVTAAFIAAFATASYALANPSTAGQDYTPIIPTNLRQYLPEPFSSSVHAVSAFLTGIGPTVPPGESWNEYAQSLNKQLKGFYSESFSHSLREYAREYQKVFLAPPPEDEPLRSDISLSSLGIIDTYFQKEHTGSTGTKVSVDSVHVNLEMGSRQMTAYVWTFSGCLNLSMNYNEAYHDAPFVQEVLLKVKGILSTELGSDLD